MGAYDLGELGPAQVASSGLQGLLEAYKMKMAGDVEQAKMRQSGFNAGAAHPERDNSMAMANLLERIRAREGREAQGIIAINPITGEKIPVAKGARFVTPPGAVAAQKKITSAENLLNVIKIQRQKLKSLPQGRVVGRGASLWNKLTGLDPDVGVFNSIHAATLPLFARTIGEEVGPMTEPEQIRAAEIDPSLVKTPAELAGTLSFMETLLRDRMKRNKPLLSGGMFPGGMPSNSPEEIDPVDEFGEP